MGRWIKEGGREGENEKAGREGLRHGDVTNTHARERIGRLHLAARSAKARVTPNKLILVVIQQRAVIFLSPFRIGAWRNDPFCPVTSCSIIVWAFTK